MTYLTFRFLQFGDWKDRRATTSSLENTDWERKPCNKNTQARTLLKQKLEFLETCCCCRKAYFSSSCYFGYSFCSPKVSDRDTLLKSALYENTSQLLEIYEQSLSRHSAGHRVAQLRMKPDNVRIRSRARNFPGKKLEVGERNNFFQLCLLKRGFI